MALVGHISGSVQSSSTIGITGSVIIANSPSSTFPSLSSDTTFFVSGSRGTNYGKSVFGGDLILSGALFADGDRLEMTGTLLVTQGISGSLTRLTDGTAYLRAGPNISIVTQSNGSVTISNTFIPADDFFDSTISGSIFTTGSAAFRGQESVNSPSAKGSDVFFYVSGSRGVNSDRKSLFGGDLIVSGTLFVDGDILEMSGTLLVTEGISGSLTRLTDGTSYLRAGNNITITSASNGSITLTATTDDFFDSTINGSIFTTGSTAFRGQESVNSPSVKGSDVFFYVSGSSGTISDRKSLFGGDVVVSGSFIGFGNRLEVTGTLAVTEGISGSLTRLTDGTSYLIAGSNITITSQSNGSLIIVGATQAPVDASYLILGNNATLSSERAFTPGTGLLGNDAGANASYTLSINDNVVSTISGSTFVGATKHNLGISGSLTKLTDGTSYLIAGTNVTISSQSNGAVTITGATQAPTNASYLVLGTDATLTAERTFTPGMGLSGTDGGANGSYTLAINDSVVATVSGTTFTGATKHNAGLSGSLTNLTDGSSYLIAGTNISITTGSNGAVTITNTFVQVDDYFDSTTDGSIFTTGSAAFVGQEPSVDSPADKGTDVFFYVSGSQGSKGGATPGVALFGGDVVISGTLYGGSPLKVSGSMQVSGSFSQGTNSLTIGADSHAEGYGSVAGCFGYSSSITAGLVVLNSSYGDVTAEFSGYDYVIVDSLGSGPGRIVCKISSVAFNSPSTEITLANSITAFTANIGIEYYTNPAGADKILGNYSHAEGAGYAQGTLSHAEGLGVATGESSHAESYGTASGVNSHAEGGSFARGQYSHAEGDNTEAMGDASHAEGYYVSASALYSHAEGEYTRAEGRASHAEGQYTLASGEASHAEGYYTTASAIFSHAEGEGTYAAGNGSHAEGFFTWASEQYSHAEGYFTTGSGYWSHAEGVYAYAEGAGSHAEGGHTQAIGGYSHAEGWGSLAQGGYSHAEGYLTTGSGPYSHAEGYKTLASGFYSHAEGFSTTGSSYYSHAEGNNTLAAGYSSHAEGTFTVASGLACHAEGADSIATLDYSHAEGNNTRAYGRSSHSEGEGTNAIGSYSHAEGYLTYADGEASHAEGFGTSASGSYSHAGGRGTIASGSAQTVIGKYNTRGNNFSLFVVGNGTNDAARSDIFRVEQTSVQVSGSLSVSGSYSGNTVTLSGGGTINSDGHSVLLTSTGVGNAVTLANGTASGQLKYVVANSGHTGGNTSVITPTSALGYTTVTFDANGDATTFFWTGANWVIVGSYGASIT